MIAVSDAWKAAHEETLLPETFVEITYTATVPGLQDDAILSGVNGTWYNAFVSNVVSGADGSFSTVPQISLSFPTVRNELLPGITIFWELGYATRFLVQAWVDDEIVAYSMVCDNTEAKSVVWVDIERFNKITVDVLSWSVPTMPAVCSEVFLGVKSVYTKTDLMGFEHSQTADLLSAALPKSEITFNLRNDDNRWNPDNPTGTERYLLERQEIKLRYGMQVGDEIEWIKGGTFWLSEWNTPSNSLEATFTARDAIEFMEDIYTGPRSGTLYEIATAAFEQASLPKLDNGDVRYKLSSVLGNYNTNFTEDSTEYSISQILQMVAHAGNCVFWQDRDGVVNIEPWGIRSLDYRLSPNICFAHPEYEIGKPVKAISVGYGNGARALVAVSNSGAVQTVDNVMLNTLTDARRVAERAKEVLSNRRVVTGDFRADVRLDVLDPIVVTSKYATNNVIAVTDLQYSATGGAIRGRYTGRVISGGLNTEDRRSGEFYVGEFD